MNNFSKITVFIFLVAGLLFYSCKKKVKFSVEPEIIFKSFEKFDLDSAHLVISFTDGDGDIGPIQEGDTATNYFINYYQKVNGVFIQKSFSALNKRIPNLNSSKKSKSLEGDIVINMLSPFYFNTSKKDTFLFEMYIVDRALHQSNSVRSDEIIAP